MASRASKDFIAANAGPGEFFGYFSAALAQLVVGVTLVGIGLGLWRIARHP